jgi:hypothetical protein
MRKAHGTNYVGIDLSKDKLAFATAGSDRGDEVLSLGTFENTPTSVDKLLKKLVGRGDISVCYEAGPTGCHQALVLRSGCALRALRHPRVHTRPDLPVDRKCVQGCAPL